MIRWKILKIPLFDDEAPFELPSTERVYVLPLSRVLLESITLPALEFVL